jgi:RNA polymerase sigma-70 factor (ECF subfamily)
MDSEECLNDTYLNTWNSIPPERPNAFQVFISKIIRNAAIDKFRERSASKRIPSELVMSYDELDECISAELTPELRAEMDEIARVLNEFLNSLSNDEALMFICRYYYSDPVERIAKMLKTSKSTVYRDLSQLREQLRARFEKEGIKI